MMHRPWSSIVEVPYCFSRSNVKFHGHTALKIVKFYRNWAFLDSNSSLNSLMVMKCCTKLETAKERCPIVFQSHPSNFKVTRDKTSPLLTRIGRFRTIGRSQLSNPSDLPCFTKKGYPRLMASFASLGLPFIVKTIIDSDFHLFISEEAIWISRDSGAPKVYEWDVVSNASVRAISSSLRSVWYEIKVVGRLNQLLL